MLKVLRKKGVAKKILWFIAIVIIITFGFFGTAGIMDNSGRPNYAGKIFGQKVSFDDFETSFKQTRTQAIMRYGDNFNKISEFLNLDSEAWDRLMLLHEAQKRNIKISDDEIVKAIESMPYFQRNGQFDTLLYTDSLRYIFRVEPREFEEGVRDSLKISKLFDAETSNLVASEDEIYEAYKAKNQKVQVSYALFTDEQFKNQAQFDETQAQTYYEAHKNEFLIPTSVNIEYIFIEYPENADAAAKTNIAEQANKIQNELKSSSDLKAIASQNNLAIETTGLFNQQQPNLKIGWSYPLLQKAFELKTDEISAPIETPKGYYILKLTERKEAYTPEFAEALPKVKDALQLEEAHKITKQKAEELLKQVKEQLSSHNDDFTKTAKSLGLGIEQTPAFARGEYLPTVGISKDFQDIAFSLNKDNALSNVIEVGKGYGFLHLDAYLPINEEQFNKEKNEFAQNLMAGKRSEAFTDFLMKLRLKANLVDNISKLKKQNQP